MAKVVGYIAGGSGHVAKTILTGEVFSGLKNLTNSAAWGTTSAIAKNKLAKLLAAGDVKGATALMSMMERGASRIGQEQARNGQR